MFAFIGTPGPWQVILVTMVLVLLFGRRLPSIMHWLMSNFLRPIDPRAARQAARRAAQQQQSTPIDMGIVLQMIASVFLVLALHYVIGPMVALLCTLILAGLALSRL